MTREEAIRWYEAKLMVNERFGLLGNQHEAAKLALEALKQTSSVSVKTPLGTIIVRPTHDPEYPGVFVDLRRTDADQDLLLALVEFTETEGDLPKAGHVITHVYGDAMADEYTDRIVHHGIEDYFRIEEAEGNE